MAEAGTSATQLQRLAHSVAFQVVSDVTEQTMHWHAVCIGLTLTSILVFQQKLPGP